MYLFVCFDLCTRLNNAYFLKTAFLKFNFNGMPVADGSIGWWLVNFSAA